MLWQHHNSACGLLSTPTYCVCNMYRCQANTLLIRCWASQQCYPETWVPRCKTLGRSALAGTTETCTSKKRAQSRLSDWAGMILLPPGCSGSHRVTSSTIPALSQCSVCCKLEVCAGQRCRAEMLFTGTAFCPRLQETPSACWHAWFAYHHAHGDNWEQGSSDWFLLAQMPLKSWALMERLSRRLSCGVSYGQLSKTQRLTAWKFIASYGGMVQEGAPSRMSQHWPAALWAFTSSKLRVWMRESSLPSLARQ